MPELITAADLARSAGVGPKQFRQWLRNEQGAGNSLLSNHEHNEPWIFTNDVADALLNSYRSRCRSTFSNERTELTFTAIIGPTVAQLDAEILRLEGAFASTAPGQDPASLPALAGIYSFWATGSDTLVDLGLLHVEGEEPLVARPLYIGKAEDSLRDRVAGTHFKVGKTGRSTARRTFAALLGLQSCKRSTSAGSLTPKQMNRLCINYGLVSEDEKRLSDWMTTKLVIRAVASSYEPLESVEYGLKLLRRPPLNIQKAPWPNPWRRQLEAARTVCRENARLN